MGLGLRGKADKEDTSMKFMLVLQKEFTRLVIL
jgi:hypothetical protein